VGREGKKSSQRSPLGERGEGGKPEKRSINPAFKRKKLCLVHYKARQLRQGGEVGKEGKTFLDLGGTNRKTKKNLLSLKDAGKEG